MREKEFIFKKMQPFLITVISDQQTSSDKQKRCGSLLIGMEFTLEH
jgi:hypothetical protein